MAAFQEAKIRTNHQHCAVRQVAQQCRSKEPVRYARTHLYEGSDTKSCVAAARMSLFGFTETLGKEGGKYNILANLVAPVGNCKYFLTSNFVLELTSPADASYITGTTIPADPTLNVKAVLSLVAVLAHPTTKSETGSMFEVGDGRITKLRWERAVGALLNPDSSFTSDGLLLKWAVVNDFFEPSYPQGPADIQHLMAKARELREVPADEMVQFRGKVALVTGAGAG